MSELKDKMNHISDMLATVEQLIQSGKLKRNHNKIIPLEDGKLIVETVYDDDASMVVIEKGMAGQDFPLHIHKDCIQFLICVKGKFSINLPEDNLIRVIRPKDCFTVSESCPHSVHCLENDSKLIGVVIPAEPMYRCK